MRIRIRLALTIAGLAGMANPAQSQTPTALLEDRPCEPPRTPAEIIPAWRSDSSGFADWLTPARYRRLVATWECRRIVYSSEGLRIVGFIYRPIRPNGRYPAIIVNRGGTGDFGKMHARLQPYYLPYLEAGYVITMSQYRGADGGDGRDEYGGADTTDVTRLTELTAALPYVDPRQLFMLGFSRGGMMTYRALAMGLPIRAAATVSGLADLEAQTRYRPEMRDSVYRVLWPDYDQRAAEHYRVRSAVQWPDRIRTPLLLIHGTNDDRVKSADALALARALDSLGRSYELIIHAGDGHGVPAHKYATDRRIIAWFDRHRIR